MQNKSILAAAKQDYKAFEKEMNTQVEDKMKTMLSGFMGHLEKNMFEPEE